MPKQIFLVCATIVEAKLLTKALFSHDSVTWIREDKFLYWTHTLNDTHMVVFVVTGMGLTRALDGLRSALRTFHNVESVIGFGLAGGLIKTAKQGDLVVPKTVQSGKEKWVPLLSLKNFLTGQKKDAWNKLMSVDHVVTSPIDKAGIYAASGMEAVDMESGSWAKACVEEGVKSWTVVRVILDGGEETLPDMGSVVNEMGEVIPHKAILHFVLHPSHLKKAISLRPTKLQEVIRPGAEVIASYLESKG